MLDKSFDRTEVVIEISPSEDELAITALRWMRHDVKSTGLLRDIDLLINKLETIRASNETITIKFVTLTKRRGGRNARYK